MRATIVLLIPVTLLILFSGCQSPTVDSSILETQVAARIFGTQTASVPTVAKPPTSTPTLEPTPTSIPTVEAVVKAATLNMREGPDIGFPVIVSLARDDKVNVIGQYRDCDWLLVNKADGKQGWIKAGAGYAAFVGECGSIPTGLYRPSNGFIIKDDRSARGMGILTVDNGLDTDGVVALTRGSNTVLVAFYLYRQDKFILNGIPDGEYQIFFSTGKDWTWVDGTFTTIQQARKFDDPLTFVTSYSTYTTYSLTLHPVAGGTARTIDIDPGSFPSMK